MHVVWENEKINVVQWRSNPLGTSKAVRKVCVQINGES
jgi:hypothetical protein